MIPLTRLNGDQVAINPDRIERADITPDVVLTMADGSKFVIHESLDELIDRIRLFRASVLALSHRLVFEGDDDPSGEGHLRVVRGGTSGTVVDTHEVVRATRPVNLRAVDGSAPAEATTTAASGAASGLGAPLDGATPDDAVSSSAADGRRP
jgi:flagellar protein FlbD